MLLLFVQHFLLLIFFFFWLTDTIWTEQDKKLDNDDVNNGRSWRRLCGGTPAKGHGEDGHDDDGHGIGEENPCAMLWKEA